MFPKSEHLENIASLIAVKLILALDRRGQLVKRGAIFANELDVKQFDGWTESWSTKSSTPLNFSELLEWVCSDEAR